MSPSPPLVQRKCAPNDLPNDPADTFESQSRILTTPRHEDFTGLTLLKWGIGGVNGPVSGPNVSDSTAFRLLRPIGQGGMGEVWEAEQTSLGRIVAVKRIKPQSIELLDSDSLERRSAILAFQQEACISARLEHPNIVPVHDQGISADGMPLLAMKRVYGSPWNRLIREDWPKMNSADFLSRHVPILIQVSQAVAFAHSRGIVHRDLKPSQVIVGEFGEVLLMDWGLALDLKDIESGAPLQPNYPLVIPDREMASNPSGTPAYMAPEQTEETATNIGRWTDVYLLGGTLFFMLTLTTPHQSDNPGGAFEHAANGQVEDPRQRVPDLHIPAELAELCNEALRRDPGDRIPTAAAFTQRLQDYLTGASRRRQSQEITKELDDRLGKEEQGYRVFADSLARLSEAASLWHDNPRVVPLRARLLTEYARAALRHGDLMLARVQGEQLAGGESREELLGEVKQAERSAKSQRRRLRAAVVGIVALLTILLVTSVAVSREFQQQRDTEKGLRQDAERARLAAALRAQDSMSLVEFLTNGISGHLDPQLPRDQELITLVGDQVVKHFREIDLTGEAPETKNAYGHSAYRVASAVHEMGRDHDAAVLAHMAVELFMETMGEDSPGTRAALSNEADYLRRIGRMDESETDLLRLARMLEEASTPVEWHERWLSAHRMGDLQRETGRWPEAEASYQSALKYASMADDPTSGAISTANTRIELGNLYQFVGRRDEAAALYMQALETRRAIYGAESQEVAYALNDFANNLKDSGKLDEAWDAFMEVKAAFEKVMPPDHPRFIQLWQRLAEIEYVKQNYDTARDYYEQARALSEKTYGPDYYYLAPLLQGLGNIAFLQRRYEDASYFFNRSYEIQIKRHGPDSPYLSELCMSMGALYSHLKDPRAEEYFKKALDITRKHYSPDHPNLGAALINLASYYSFGERYDEAEPLIDEALANLRKAYGPDHPYFGTAVGMALQTKCWIARARTGDAQSAKWKEGLELYEANKDAQSVPILRAYHAELLLRLGRKEEAIEAFGDRSLQGVSDDGLEEYFIDNGLLEPKKEEKVGL